MAVITSKEGLENTKESIESFMTAKNESERFKDYPTYHELEDDPAAASKVCIKPPVCLY